MVDDELLVPLGHDVPLEPRALLTDLLDSDLFDVTRFADQGPPVDAPRVAGYPGAVVGWAVPTERYAPDSLGVYLADEETVTLAGVFGNGHAVSRGDTAANCYQELPAERAAEKREADGLAAEIASQAVGADVYVSERPYLQAATWRPGRGTLCCPVTDALALVGLYQRAQGLFLATSRFSLGRGLFFWVGVRELLPEAWRWFAACVQHAHSASGDESLAVLAGTLLQRVDRALRSRDEVHVALNRVQNRRTQEDAVAELDSVLIHLMAAVDVAARVAHRALGLPSDEFRAAWQHREWQREVRKASPELAAVVRAGAPGRDTLTILRLLRNTVHGEALQGIALHRSGLPMESLVGLPSSQEDELLEAMDRLGGRSAWGVRPAIPGAVHVDAGVLVDRLFEWVPRLLNGLLGHTPVESLPGARLRPEDCVPPASPSSSMVPRSMLGATPFEPWVRASVRWQLGLSSTDVVEPAS